MDDCLSCDADAPKGIAALRSLI